MQWSPLPETPNAPGVGGASLHVLAVADTGSGNKHQMAVGQQMAQVNRRQPVDREVASP
jgi:hypothetical protein